MIEFLSGIPIWILSIITLIIIFVGWKLIKFAIKTLVALVLIIGSVIILDFSGILGHILNFFGF